MKTQIKDKRNRFEPFQKVLVKVLNTASDSPIWTSAWYGHYDASTNRHCLIGAKWVDDNEIIPFEGNESKLNQIAK